MYRVTVCRCDASINYLHIFLFFFFFNDPATTEIYTLSLHDALPISGRPSRSPSPARANRRKSPAGRGARRTAGPDRKSTRLNSSHVEISYAVFCLKKKKDKYNIEL